MPIIPTQLPDVFIIEPKVFVDDRGFFFESFNQKLFETAVGHPVNFVQDNHSQSQYGVLRGLHYQLAPYAQGKLVRCIEGEVFDVAVDLRRYSKSFGQWVGVHLSAENKRQLWIPEGFAHGFLALTERVQFVYKATNYYAPNYERCVCWNDPDINIQWPTLPEGKLSLSTKDQHGVPLKLADTYDK